MDLQAKLLRVLQTGEFERVGGESTLTSNVRVLAATNKDLKARISEGKFREDLYYRLNVVAIALPPLRERREDIPLLAEHVVRKLAQKYGWPHLALAPEAMDELSRRPWRGNVRELQNVLTRAAILVARKGDPGGRSRRGAGARRRRRGSAGRLAGAARCAGGDGATGDPAGAGAGEVESHAGGAACWGLAAGNCSTRSGCMSCMNDAYDPSPPDPGARTGCIVLTGIDITLPPRTFFQRLPGIAVMPYHDASMVEQFRKAVGELATGCGTIRARVFAALVGPLSAVLNRSRPGELDADFATLQAGREALWRLSDEDAADVASLIVQVAFRLAMWHDK